MPDDTSNSALDTVINHFCNGLHRTSNQDRNNEIPTDISLCVRYYYYTLVTALVFWKRIMPRREKHSKGLVKRTHSLFSSNNTRGTRFNTTRDILGEARWLTVLQGAPSGLLLRLADMVTLGSTQRPTSRSSCPEPESLDVIWVEPE